MSNLEDKLKLIKKVKEFAINEIGICKNNSFEKYKKMGTLYGLYISHKDRIEPLDYYGFELFEHRFERNKRKKDLIDENFDTLSKDFEAYGSELCPITEQLLRSSPIKIVCTVLHENFHIHARKRGLNLRQSIEEAIADSFAYNTAKLFFQNDLEMLKELEEFTKRHLDLAKKSNKIVNEAEKLYKVNFLKARSFIIQINEIYKKHYYGSKEEKKEIEKEYKFYPIGKQRINNAYFIMIKKHFSFLPKIFFHLKNKNPKEYINNRSTIQEIVKHSI